MLSEKENSAKIKEITSDPQNVDKLVNMGFEHDVIEVLNEPREGVKADLLQAVMDAKDLRRFDSGLVGELMIEAKSPEHILFIGEHAENILLMNGLCFAHSTYGLSELRHRTKTSHNGDMSKVVYELFLGIATHGDLESLGVAMENMQFREDHIEKPEAWRTRLDGHEDTQRVFRRR